MRKELSYKTLFNQNDSTSFFSVPLSYTYSALSINEELFHKKLFKADILTQGELPTDWDEYTLADIEDMRLQVLTGDADTSLEEVFLNQSVTLTSFFASQMVDIPTCFKRIKSLYAPSMSTPELRLITMLMRHGRRSYIAKNYSRSLHRLSRLNWEEKQWTPESASWRLYYSLFAQIKLTHSIYNLVNYSSAPLDMNLEDNYSQSFTKLGQLARENNWFQELLFTDLSQYAPVFSFYVSKVDKLKRKHSRGKTGKYSIGWKFIPKYKRLLIVLRWLVRDIRFQKSKTISQRIQKSLENLIFDKPSHLVFQLRNFVHKFVFQNYRKTLLRNLKSSS